MTNHSEPTTASKSRIVRKALASLVLAGTLLGGAAVVAEPASADGTCTTYSCGPRLNHNEVMKRRR
jgi:hypothetical protein